MSAAKSTSGEEELRALAGHSRSEVRGWVVRNPACPVDVQRMLAEDRSRYVREEAAHSPHAVLSQVSAVLAEGSTSTLSALANGQIDRSILESLISEACEYPMWERVGTVAEWILCYPGVGPELLELAWESLSESQRLRSCPEVSGSSLNRLPMRVQRELVEVQLVLAKTGKKAALKALASRLGRSDYVVDDRVAMELLSRNPITARALAGGKFSEAAGLAIAEVGSPQTHARLLENPYCPIATLRWMAESAGSEDVRSQAVWRLGLPQEHVTWHTGDE